MTRVLYPFLIAGALFLTACGTDNPFDRGSDFDAGLDQVPVGEVSFSTHVISALQACASCHSGGAGGWSYSGGAGAWEAVVPVIDEDHPEESALLVKGTGGDGHGGGTVFTVGSTEYQTILAWIEQGAPNN